MNIAEEIINSAFNMDFEDKINLVDLESDYSNFVFVDGEEGDYGVILYSLDGVLFVKCVVEGGDSEYYEITEACKQFYAKKIIDRLNEWIKE